MAWGEAAAPFAGAVDSPREEDRPEEEFVRQENQNGWGNSGSGALPEYFGIPMLQAIGSDGVPMGEMAVPPGLFSTLVACWPSGGQKPPLFARFGPGYEGHSGDFEEPGGDFEQAVAFSQAVPYFGFPPQDAHVAAPLQSSYQYQHAGDGSEEARPAGFPFAAPGAGGNLAATHRATEYLPALQQQRQEAPSFSRHEPQLPASDTASQQLPSSAPSAPGGSLASLSSGGHGHGHDRSLSPREGPQVSRSARGELSKGGSFPEPAARERREMSKETSGRSRAVGNVLPSFLVGDRSSSLLPPHFGDIPRNNNSNNDSSFARRRTNRLLAGLGLADPASPPPWAGKASLGKRSPLRSPRSLRSFNNNSSHQSSTVSSSRVVADEGMNPARLAERERNWDNTLAAPPTR
ncbi:unnamed protein product, partial [Polarella glacialis]